MDNNTTKNDKPQAITPVNPGNGQGLIMFNPREVIAQATDAANALRDILVKKPKKVIMNGEQYLEYEDWQTLGKFYGYTAGVAEGGTKEIIRDGKLFGYSASAVVYHNGVIVSGAEASCMRDEAKWNTHTKYEWKTGADGRSFKTKVGEEPVPEFQLKSMAQTRACAKGLRNVLSWVAVLAGYRPTPAEELPDEAREVINKPQPTKAAAPGAATGPVRTVEGEVVNDSSRQQKCQYCGTLGKYHKKGCPGAPVAA